MWDDLFEFSGDFLNSALDGVVEVEKEKASNNNSVPISNNANPSNTATEALQSANAPVAKDNTLLHVGLGVGFLLFILILVFALKGKKS